MSEQPIQSMQPEPLERGTVFDGDSRIDLHLNTVPNFDQKAIDFGRSVFEKAQTIETPSLSDAAVIGANLRKLCNVRDQYKLIEQTKFFSHEDWDSGTSGKAA